MADRLSIFNAALRLLGDAHGLSSLTEEGPARRALDSAWRSTGEALLTEGFWNFAIRSVELSNDEDVEPRFGFDYAFSKPDDWVRTLSISDSAKYTEGFQQYEDEQDYWYASIDTLYIRYVSNDDDYGWNIAKWRSPFVKAFEAYLAFECGLPISGDKATRNDVFNIYRDRLKRAKVIDAVDEPVRQEPRGRLVRSRGSRLRSGER